MGDLDGDGRPEAILASHEGLWVTDGRGRVLAQAPALGHCNALALPGPAARDTFFVGWGQGRHHLKGPSRVLAYRLAGGRLTSETLLVKESPRPAVSGLAWGSWKGQRGLLIGAYKDKYEVDLVFAVRQGAAWRAEPVATVRMANAFTLAPVRTRGTDDLVVGRLYGDARGTPGDAFVLEPSGRRVPMTIQGGLRALAAADTDGDGLAELYLGDGWAQAYRKDGRALLSRASFRGGAFHSEPVGALEGEFMVQKVVASDLDGDRRPELLVLGDASLTVFRKRPTGPWTKSRLAGGDLGDFAVGDLDGDGKPDLLLAYPQELRRVRSVTLP